MTAQTERRRRTAEITDEKRAYDAGWKIGRQRGARQAVMSIFENDLVLSAKEQTVAEMFASLPDTAQRRFLEKFRPAS